MSFTQAAASNEDGGEEEKTPSLSISSETIMSFAANGGPGKITYVLKNKVEDVVVTAEPLFAEGLNFQLVSNYIFSYILFGIS